MLINSNWNNHITPLKQNQIRRLEQLLYTLISNTKKKAPVKFLCVELYIQVKENQIIKCMNCQRLPS